MPIEWNSDLSIGVLEVDVQHKILFEKFNTFVDAYQADKDQEEVLRMFWFLEAYAITHFKDEEKLMQEVDFPDFLRHREKHKSFADELLKLKERLTAEGPSQKVFSKMATFISGWLLGHITVTDRAIGDFINNERAQL